MAKKTSKRKTLNILDKNKKHSQFDYTEIFRHIRTNIEFSTVDKDIKSICITSSQAKQHYLLTLLIFLQQNIIEFY